LKHTAEKRLSENVVVVKAKLHRPTPIEIVADTKYADPSHESEKPRNPVEFRKTSFSKGFCSVPLWPSTPLTARHVRILFGEPTRICSDHVEYVLQIPTREVVKLVLTNNRVAVWGFQKTPTLERWVDRLLAS